MIHIHIPNLPISSDHAYESVVRSVGKGKTKKRITVRRLSDAGKKYKSETKKHIVKNYPHVLPFFVENFPYLVIVEFTFPERGRLYNNTWDLFDNPKKRAKSRYKRLDVSNRLKLFEDALAEAVGLDDKHNFFVGCSKTWALGREATNVWVFNRETERDNPIDALLTQLKSAGQAQPH